MMPYPGPVIKGLPFVNKKQYFDILTYAFFAFCKIY